MGCLTIELTAGDIAVVTVSGEVDVSTSGESSGLASSACSPTRLIAAWS